MIRIAHLLATIALLAPPATAMAVADTATVTIPAAAADTPAMDPAAAKAAQKARAKQLAEWKRQYGDGPYPDEIDAFLTTKPAALRPFYKTLYAQGERNSVLNFERLGLAAMQTGDWKDAEHAFDGALTRIEAVYGKNKQAEAAKSVFRKESNKSFKGEPYERAMAYYYRGMLYLRAGDYDNAHAAFKDAEYQDTQSEQEEFQSDFALLDYLAGWSSHCGGQETQAADAYAAAIKANAAIVPPPRDANTLMIVEYGSGPLKARDGTQKEKLVFNAGPGQPETGASFQLTGAPVAMPAVPISSVYTQATTRGGRAIDGVLAGKASWKSGTENTGAALAGGGLSMMGSNNLAMQQAGGYMALASLGFSLLSSAMKADADTRTWDTLPDQIGVATMRAPAGSWSLKTVYTGGKGAADIKPAAVMQSSAKACSIAWVRTHDVLAAPAEAPGDDAAVASGVARHKDVAMQDKQFRTTLASN